MLTLAVMPIFFPALISKQHSLLKGKIVMQLKLKLIWNRCFTLIFAALAILYIGCSYSSATYFEFWSPQLLWVRSDGSGLLLGNYHIKLGSSGGDLGVFYKWPLPSGFCNKSCALLLLSISQSPEHTPLCCI